MRTSASLPSGTRRMTSYPVERAGLPAMSTRVSFLVPAKRVRRAKPALAVAASPVRKPAAMSIEVKTTVMMVLPARGPSWRDDCRIMGSWVPVVKCLVRQAWISAVQSPSLTPNRGEVATKSTAKVGVSPSCLTRSSYEATTMSCSSQPRSGEE